MGTTAQHLRSRLPDRIAAALDEVCHLLGEESLVFVFGSHAEVPARATAKSDFDVGFVARPQLTFRRLALIRHAAEGLAWPYRLDLVDFSQATSEFRQVALDAVIVLQGSLADVDLLRRG